MSRPRKTYRPKPVRIPVTGGLVEQFRQTLRDCEIGLRLAPNDKAVSGFAQMFNVISLAAHRKLPGDHDLRLLQGGSLALQAMIDAHERTGTWILGPLDQTTLVVAGEAAQRLLGRLDVMSLYQAMLELRGEEPG
jgi:hypothetical protein